MNRSSLLLAVSLTAQVARAQDADAPPAPSPAPSPQQASATPGAQPAPSPVVSPPKPLATPDAVPPRGEVPEGDGQVIVQIVVTADGSVTKPLVVKSAGAAFDAAAIEAVVQWRFSPAQRDGVAMASRIAIPFQFQQPEPPPGEVPAGTADAVEMASPTPSPNATPTPTSDPAPDAGGPPLPAQEVHVRGARHSRAAGDFHVHRDVLNAAPRQEGAEVLRSAPGVYIARGEGAAVAHNYVLRGFDAEHGQDITFRVGGLPINLPSHIHGQGYADLGFLIAETTRELRVREGLYDPHQGDFAVAGSIDLELGVEGPDRGITAKAGYGSFGTRRYMVSWAPVDEPEETFGAVQLQTTDGFGENRNATSGSAILQHRFGTGGSSYRAVGIAHAARANSAGVVRRDDVLAGTVCFTCVYDHPSARAQNALASRVMLGLFADYDEPDGASGQLGAWFSHDGFRTQQNFTGFIERSRSLEGAVGRGDLIEQRNRTLSFGLSGEYRSPTLTPFEWLKGTVETGTEGRLDLIEQSQNLLDATVRSQTWDERVDANIRGLDLGFFGDLDFTVAHVLRARLGMRADLLTYEVEDRLGNFAPSTRPDDAFITGFRRSSLGIVAGPRASVEAHPVAGIALLAAYGEGYRSPQARTLEDGEDAPFATVRSLDVGARFGEHEDDRLTVGGYFTQLSDDVAFDASEGRLERIGATRRLGVVVQGVTHPVEGLVASGSVTIARATLLEPPPASAEEPTPPYVNGQRLPFVAPIVARADVSYGTELGTGVDAQLGLGFNFLSPRPLPYGDDAASLWLLDATFRVNAAPFTFSLDAYNLLDRSFAAMEYNFASDWNPDDGFRSRIAARHQAAGAPRSLMLSLALTL